MMIKNLNYKYSHTPEINFVFKNDSYTTIAHQVVTLLKAYNSSRPLPSYAEAIKQEDRRYVFRIKNENKALKFRSFIVKVFPFRTFRHKFQFYWKRHTQTRFGYGEANALVKAKNLGINVPEVYGYGQFYKKFKLLDTDIIIMQDLSNHTDIGVLLNQCRNNQNECKKILSRATPIFTNLYNCGCNNIDMNLGAILLSNEQKTNDDYVLDFEYSQFSNDKSIEILMSNSALFANNCKNILTEDTINWWIGSILDEANVTDTTEREHYKDRFRFYFNNKLSRKQRMKL